MGNPKVTDTMKRIPEKNNLQNPDSQQKAPIKQ